jgi:Uma2 family endonuclease
MSTATRAKPYTFDDFCALVNKGQKGDLIDGVIYVASPDNTDANEIFMWLGALITFFVRAGRLGKVFGSRVAFRLDETNGPEPDIAFVSKKKAHLIKRGRVEGPPDVAIEIVSPDSVERDYQKKRLQYQQAGIPEYWIIDEIEQKVIWLRLSAQGDYREVRSRKGELLSKALPGFWFRPEWLWQDPLPDIIEVLRLIQARQGKKG